MGERPFGPDGTTTSDWRQRKLGWKASESPDVVKYVVYTAPSGNSAQFLEKIEAGLLEASAYDVTTTEAQLGFLPIIPILTESVGVPDGNWQFAVCAIDTSGNFSDPHQSIEWTSVKIKLTPPHPPKGGDVA